MEIRILYRNHRGEVAIRSILPDKVWFGVTPWHKGEQWFLRATDVRHEFNNPLRDFALADVLAWGDEAIANFEVHSSLRQAAREEAQRN